MYYPIGSERQCPICKRSFIFRSEWAYHNGKKYYCSWGCLRKDEKRRTTKVSPKKQTRKLTPEIEEEIRQLLRKGESCWNTAIDVGVTVYAVHKVKSKMTQSENKEEQQ